MFFNEKRKPMIVFGVDINKFYKEIQLLGKLPKFCDNLRMKPTDKLFMKYFESKIENTNEVNTDINNNINQNNNKNKRQLKKEELTNLIERLTKISPKKKLKKLKKIHLFESIKLNKEIFNLSDRLPSPTKILEKLNEDTNSIIRKKKRIYHRNILNISRTDKQNIETSSINNLSISKIDKQQNLSLQNKNRNEYVKKWNLPKIIKFDKILGREKNKSKNPNKFKSMEVAKRYYSPNFNYIYSDNNSYVNFSPNEKSFNKIKLNLTRKIIFNHEMLSNSSSKNLFLIDAINKEKKKKKELKLKKLKEKYGKLFEFLNYDINKNKLELSLLNKNINDF